MCCSFFMSPIDCDVCIYCWWILFSLILAIFVNYYYFTMFYCRIWILIFFYILYFLTLSSLWRYIFFRDVRFEYFSRMVYSEVIHVLTSLCFLSLMFLTWELKKFLPKVSDFLTLLTVEKSCRVFVFWMAVILLMHKLIVCQQNLMDYTRLKPLCY
jgi:hypothetical protein